MKPTFRFRSSYLNCFRYDVTDDTGDYVIEYRTGVSNYERHISNYNDAEWERDVVAAIGLLYRTDPTTPIPVGTVAAFNDWRQAERDKWLEKWKANPDRYGPFDPDHEAAQPIELVKGAYYIVGTGWVDLDGLEIVPCLR